MPTENRSQHVGIRCFFGSQAFFFGTEVEALVDLGGTTSSVDFQGPEKGEGFSGTGLEPGEVVGNKKTRRVGKIRKAVGIPDHETCDFGHGQEDLRRAPAKKPAKRKARSTIGIRRSKPKR